MIAETLLTDIIPHKKAENEANNGGKTGGVDIFPCSHYNFR